MPIYYSGGGRVASLASDIPVTNAETAFNFFVSQGFNTFQAAAIVGNFMVESNVNPEAIQPNGPGRGIAQWSAGGRWRPNLMIGFVHSDLQNQLVYVMTELNSNYSRAKANMLATTNITEAVQVWAVQYEQYGATQSLPTRVADAKQVLLNSQTGNWAAVAPHAAAGSSSTSSTSAIPLTPGVSDKVPSGSIPGFTPGFVAPAGIDPALFTVWPFSSSVSALANAVTTQSTLDLTYDQLGQIQLTVVDPDWSITGPIIGQINQTDSDSTLLNSASSQQIAYANSQFTNRQVIFNGDSYTVSEFSTTDTDGVPCGVITLRTSCLDFMSCSRAMRNDGGISATQWIEDRVYEYNQIVATKGGIPVTFNGEVTAARGQISTNIDPSLVTWTSDYEEAQQLAVEEGFWLFESGNGVWFGSPAYLASTAPTFKVNYSGIGSPPNPHSAPGPGVFETTNVPECLRSDQVFTGDTMTFELPHNEGEQIRVGQTFSFTGIPKFGSGPGLPAGGELASELATLTMQPDPYAWMVTEVQWNFDGQATNVTVSANQIKNFRGTNPGGVNTNLDLGANGQPIDPTGTTGSATGAGSLLPNTKATGTTLQFLSVASAQIGKPYVWGATGPSSFDCSGLVQYALSQVGISFPHFTGTQYAACRPISVAQAMKTAGALVFVDNGSVVAGEHVAISMGDGVHVLEAPYTGRNVSIDAVGPHYFNEGGLIPGLNYGGGS